MIKPAVTYQVATTMDLFSTFLDFAGVPLPTDRIIDGVSLRSILTGKQKKMARDALFFYRDDLIYAVRLGPYKAHFITRSGFGIDPPIYHSPPLLFNIEHDPSEQYPLYESTFPDFHKIISQINSAVQNHDKKIL